METLEQTTQLAKQIAEKSTQLRNELDNFLNKWAEATKDNIEIYPVMEVLSYTTQNNQGYTFYLVRGQNELAIFGDYEEGNYEEIALENLIATEEISIINIEKIVSKLESVIEKYNNNLIATITRYSQLIELLTNRNQTKEDEIILKIRPKAVQ